MKTSLVVLSCLIISYNCFSQPGKFPHGSIAEMELQRYGNSVSVEGSGVGTEYDVKFYRLWLRLNPDTSIGSYVKGHVTTYFTTKQDNVTTVKFDFVSNLVIDSIKYHQVKLITTDFTEDVDTLKITIPPIALNGTLDSITVYYHGVPPPGPWGTGFVKAVHNSQNYIYTLSEPYSASSWWPCKLDVTDKADSVDLIVSNPVGFKAAGNGTLFSELTDATGVTATWKHRYAIPAYLVATAVANYQVHTSPSVNINGTIMPVYHYFFPETVNGTSTASVDRVGPMISAFSTWFGDYPFKNEKYGHYEFGFGGGMEHSTFSGMSSGAMYSWDIIAHELGHQWFGDAVTCATWGDIWINEGFAQFTEIIAAEKVPALNAYLPGLRSSIKSNALAYTSETTFRTNTSSIGTIFSPSQYIYERGAMILNMLRLTLGDTKFFQAIQNYIADPLLKYKNASTTDVKTHMQNVSGIDLNDFFDNWIYKNGHAIYNIYWGNNGNRIQFELSQTRTSGSSSTYFDMPVPVRIRGALPAQDTTVIIFDNNGIMNFDNNGVLTSTGTNRITFNLSFVPTIITFDPNSLTMASATVNYLSVLPIKSLKLTGRKESNGFQLNWDAEWSGDAKYMTVERSFDGQHFELLYSLNGPDLQSGRIFSYLDNPVYGSNSYYRISLQLTNESIYYSNIIKYNPAAFDIRISPNPAGDHVSIAITNGGMSEKFEVRIYTASGSLKGKYSFRTGDAGKLDLNVKEWSPGIYSVVIGNGIRKEIKTILIQH